MPLFLNQRLSTGTKLGIWKITEPLLLLEDIFPLLAYEQELYSKIKNENRKREWLASRILLTEISEKRVVIEYSPYGKPLLNSSTSNISISHSKNFAAVLLSSRFSPGIDIEHISLRVEKVKHKFLSADELSWCTSIEQLTTCWSAKESVFKIYEKELDFHDMVIHPFQINDNYLDSTVIKNNENRKFRVYIKKIEEDILTYTWL